MLLHCAGARSRALAWSLVALAPIASADNPAEVFELPSVTVVGTTPLPGLGTPLKYVPANVQIFNRRDFDRQRPLELTDFLGANANSVNVQPMFDVQYYYPIAFGELSKPVIAAVNGVTRGAGNNMVFAADFRIASEQANFGCKPNPFAAFYKPP